jgi:hypothetical protein
MAVNHSSRLKLVLTILFAFISVMAAQAQSSDEPSLGDVVKTQPQKKPAAKVIDNDEMIRRGFDQASANVPFDCNTECMAKAKPLAYWNFRNATDKQWQDAYAGAIADLSQGDWGQRLSEIRQEVCSNQGNEDSKKFKALEGDMFTKLRGETRSKHIDDMAAAHPNDAAGAEALRQLRVEDLKTGILEAKIELIRHSCLSPAKVPGK